MQSDAELFRQGLGQGDRYTLELAVRAALGEYRVAEVDGDREDAVGCEFGQKLWGNCDGH
ncbi:hypothetical protein D3C78_1901680 [compost metagenome]